MFAIFHAETYIMVYCNSIITDILLEILNLRHI